MRSVRIFALLVSLLVAATAGMAQEAAAPTGQTEAEKADEVQEEKQAAASTRVESWLALIDGKKYKESWDQAAPFLRRHYQRSHWVRALEASVSPLGAVTSRTARGVESHSQLPGGPPATDYMIFRFDTVFENRPVAEESVTMMWLPSEARWRVAGYFIK